MSLRVAIVGAGRMGRERARAARALGAQVEAVCDPDNERAAALAAEVGTSALSCADDLDFSDLDVLFVCTPPAVRGRTELAAISAGVSLFVEKPIGLDAEHALDLLEALEERPVINAVGYMNRYRHSVRSARNEIQNSFPIAIAFQWLASQYQVPWWLARDQSGGPINEQCTHYIDLCRYLLGEIREVQAVALPLPDVPDAEGTVAMTLRFEGGVIGTGLYSCEASQKQMAFEVFLCDRSIRLQGWDLRSPEFPEPEDIFVKEASAFFRAVERQDASIIQSDIPGALKTQAAIDAVRRAIKSGECERVLDPREVSFCA
jgi:myo-inositol 2-dehydrogenase / D-chiro-inositol 1-dehydrogenase